MARNNMEKINARRRLRPTKLGKRSKDFYVFDVETGIEDENGNIQYMLSARPEHLIFGCVYGKDYTRVLYSADEFKKEFEKKRYKNKIVYAHNAEYDLSAVYSNIYLMDGEAIFNGKFICAANYVPNPKHDPKNPKSKPFNKHARFADSYNLLPAGVKKLGELLGMPKGQLGSNGLKSHRKNLSRDIDYCFRDCEIVYRSLEKMFAHTEPSYTIGSHAVKLFRSKFLKKDIIVDGLADEFFKAMYGGRTEAFKIGKCDANVYDINSAYPWAQKLDLPDPSRLRKVESEKKILQCLRDKKIGGMITATVYVDHSEMLPALPVKYEGKLLFPTGKFTGTWVFPELRNAILNTKTKIIALHSAVVAPMVKSPFVDFIDTLYKERLSTDDPFGKYRPKLEMNNLYGKLVQRLRDEWKFFKTETEILEYMKQRKLKRCEITKVVGGWFIKYDIDKIYSHTIPCWGAYITAYVRAEKLHPFMKKHLPNLLYCDTDGVFLNTRLELDDKFLGGWKLEKKKVIEIRTLKDYVYIGENDEVSRMLKGVKKDAEQLTKDADVFKFTRMIKTRESMRRKDNRPPGTFIEQVKLLTGDYTKRVVLPNGSTRPFHF